MSTATMSRMSVDGTVGTCVTAVATSFQDATRLIEHIKLTNEGITPAHLGTIEDSLMLGPPIVLGQYDHHVRQFGEPYEKGDQDAREALKAIVIHLQLSLLATLRMALLDSFHPDFASLQLSSDKCRLDAMMCLWRLGQRVAANPPPPPPSRISSTSVSTSGMKPMPLDSLRVSTPTQSVSSVESRGFPLSPFSPVTASVNTGRSSSVGSYTTGASDLKPVGLDGGSVSSRQTGATHRFGNSVPTIRETAGRAGSSYTESVYSENSSRREPALSIGGDGSSVVGQSSEPGWRLFPRPPGPAPQPTSLASSSTTTQSPQESSQNIPSTSTKSMFGFGRKRMSKAEPPRSNGAVTNPIPMGLYLPTEENQFAGLCKGTWKLQNGMKKAFRVAMIPTGIYLQVPVWRCTKCHFEGPMAHPLPLSTSQSMTGYALTTPATSSSSQAFDARVRLHGPTGVRYRWAFLAKSHVQSGKVPSRAADGSTGSYGCVFCASESKAAVPVFGNVDTFFEHLVQVHGYGSTEPPPEQGVLDWMKCVIGRVAGELEGFDVNIPRVSEAE